jgi:hypothetical protein
MKVSIFGVLVGGVVDVVTSVLGGLPFALYSTFKLDPSLRVGPHSSEAVSAAIHGNLPLYSAQLAVGLLSSILGGYVAAAIAKRHERLNETLSCYLCVGMGIVVMSLGLEHEITADTSPTLGWGVYPGAEPELGERRNGIRKSGPQTAQNTGNARLLSRMCEVQTQERRLKGASVCGR